MFYKQRPALIFVLSLLTLGLLLTACGNSSTTGSGSTPTAVPTTAPTATPTATPDASGSTALIKTASATIDGKSVTILTNANGLTLYYRTSDTATSVCSGGCASAWPPLLFNGSGTPSSDTSLSGTLSVSNNVNGAQVAYQGHLLYTYANDTAPGQITGQGIGGVWFVATVDLKTATNTTEPATPTPAYTGY